MLACLLVVVVVLLLKIAILPLQQALQYIYQSS